jgi:hypothetical protein
MQVSQAGWCLAIAYVSDSGDQLAVSRVTLFMYVALNFAQADAMPIY